MKRTASSSPSAGFTLVEILISTTIVGVVVGCAVLIVFQALTTYYYDVGRVEVNTDMRKLTRDMTTTAVFSNYFLIYPNYATRTMTTGTGSSASTVDAIVTDGNSGDMVLFITDSVDSSTGYTQISSITGYYRDATSSAAGPVRAFTFAVPATPVGNAQPLIYNLLNTYEPTANQSTNSQVIPLAKDIANYNLFYNYVNKSVMLKSQVLEPGSVNRKATSTYNFTVTPRG